MKLRLYSDFRDYYDHMFDLEGEIHSRRAEGGLHRREMFSYLESCGYHVPINGTVREVVGRRTEDYFHSMERDARHFLKYQDSIHLRSNFETNILLLVVYTDPTAHRGEGKLVMNASTALHSYPENYCSVYAGRYEPKVTTSFRFLQIGDRSWYLVYQSQDSWRSNVGEEVQIDLVGENPRGYHPCIREPIFAVDLVQSFTTMYCVDFNTAPGLKGSPIEDILTATEVVELIKRAVQDSKIS